MEKVQLSLERFLPELRDLERKKVFTKDEISDIVSQRRSHEISLSKRDVKPVDYLRYIEYEKKLERLRKTRASRLQTTTRKTLSDHSIASHITQLHRLSTRRFPSSHSLWEAFISHTLTLASPILITRTLASAIALHPTKVNYWLMASRFESEGDGQGLGGGNTEAARKICMRGLRFLRGTKGEGEREIWNEWVRVEVSYVERIRGREIILGIGKNKDKFESKPVTVDEEMQVDGVEGEDDIDMVQEVIKEDEKMEQTEKEVEAKVLMGSEGILSGIIVKLVLDNSLESYSYSVEAHQSLISLLRILPSQLRLPLLNHVYTSLSTHILPSSPDYALAVHILATKSLYDIPYDSNQTKEEMRLEESQIESNIIKVEGEAFVDAIGEVVENYWSACRGKKSEKGKGKEKADLKVWESFCNWLEKMEELVEDENLTVFLTTNLTTALSSAPSSPSLSLLHLRHLLRTTAPHSTILSFAQSLSQKFGLAPTDLSTREEIWVARLETVVALEPIEKVSTIFGEAIKNLPFSSKIWSIQASFIERVGIENVIEWYLKSIKRCLLSDAKLPINFQSKFEDMKEVEPKEFLPRSLMNYLFLNSPELIHKILIQLILECPTLSIQFLTFTLKTVPRIKNNSKESNSFRETIFNKIISNSTAGINEYISFGEELLLTGQIAKSNEVMTRARRIFKGTELNLLERKWSAICDAL